MSYYLNEVERELKTVKAQRDDLLDALELLVSEQDNDGVLRDVPWYDDVWNIAKEAIAKAKGEE